MGDVKLIILPPGLLLSFLFSFEQHRVANLFKHGSAQCRHRLISPDMSTATTNHGYLTWTQRKSTLVVMPVRPVVLPSCSLAKAFFLPFCSPGVLHWFIYLFLFIYWIHFKKKMKERKKNLILLTALRQLWHQSIYRRRFKQKSQAHFCRVVQMNFLQG